MARGRKNKSAKNKPRGKRGGALKRVRGRGNYQVGPPVADNRVGVLAKLDRALRRIPRGAFAGAGAALGARYGGGLGQRVGRMAGAGLAAITGYGNYSVANNSITRTATSMDAVPEFSRGEHSIRVRHREFISEIPVPTNPTDFNLRSWLINPANKELFPWLGQMSRQYQQYRIHGMVIIFKSTTSDYAAAGPLGSIMMATNYNAVDREYDSKVELENSEFAVSAKPSLNLIHAIECDPKVTGLDTLYVRDPAYDTGEPNDRRFYDYGKFQFATQGLPGTPGSSMGELWITYDIELMKPIIGGVFMPGKTVLSRLDGSTAVGVDSGTQRIVYTGTASVPAVSTAVSVLPATYVASQAVALQGPVIDLQATGANKGILFKKNGAYRIWFNCLSATTATSYALANAATSILATVTRNGNAQYNGSTSTLAPAPTASYGANIVPPDVAGAVTSAIGYSYMLSYEVNVTGIVAATDTILFTPADFTTAGGNLIAWGRNVAVEWTAYGINDQLERFLPS